jgi:geranylgeranyl diphosphate synthase, type I
VPGSPRLVDLVQSTIDQLLDREAATLASISPDLAPLHGVARSFLAGGKRFRALFCYWGWQSVMGRTEGGELLDAEAPDHTGVVAIASALEVFHAAALVHDDIMDNSDLRRGRPSAHRQFEAQHREAGWDGAPERHGEAAALLLGDLLLGWSDDLFETGIRATADRDAAGAARIEFSRMRTEVTVGQYLDMLEEDSWRHRDEAELLGRARRVVVYKSAKYSVEAPLAIGGALAGADPAQLEALRAFGLPLGIAFQLRDDMLGVFGDPEVTGKPAGDDLREGKRTVLVTLARQKLPASAQRLFDELVGDPDLDAGQIGMLQTAVRDSGAVDDVERIIQREVGTALAALEDAPLSRAARDQLTQLATAVTARSA